MVPRRAQSHGLILLVACCLCVGSAGNDIQINDNFDGTLNIIKVLNTTEPYWVYYQTTSNTFMMSQNAIYFTIEDMCLKNVMTGLTLTEYNYTQYDTSESVTESANYTGRFIYTNETKPRKPPTAMKVYEEGEEEPDSIMTLVYTDPGSHKCNVYKISSVENEISNGSGGESPRSRSCTEAARNGSRGSSPPGRRCAATLRSCASAGSCCQAPQASSARRRRCAFQARLSRQQFLPQLQCLRQIVAPELR
ncbi:uncharacterized protein LOC119402922, partial [Rhipicephalus sanguineus]|uniref:uncharacterized protein LOC119402922 n=1 Tax=Rhipicephalus sanguineus TaxID=34632 RepID=UPI0018936375